MPAIRPVMTLGDRSKVAIVRYPEAVVFASLVFGVVIASIVPRQRIETRLLGHVGRLVVQRARSAGRLAFKAASEEFQSIPTTPAAALVQVQRVIARAVEIR